MEQKRKNKVLDLRFCGVLLQRGERHFRVGRGFAVRAVLSAGRGVVAVHQHSERLPVDAVDRWLFGGLGFGVHVVRFQSQLC